EDFDCNYFRDYYHRCLFDSRLWSGPRRGAESDLLPDDYSVLDHRTHVDLMGGRGGQRGVCPGWRFPAGGGTSLFGDDQSDRAAPDVQFYWPAIGVYVSGADVRQLHRLSIERAAALQAIGARKLSMNLLQYWRENTRYGRL